MTDKKWQCTTFVVLGKSKPLRRWLDRWNPWKLRRRIKMLESELQVLERECELSHESAKHNLREKEKAVGQMRSQLLAAAGLLEEAAKET